MSLSESSASPADVSPVPSGAAGGLRPLTNDAIVLVPGIMGSRLVEAADPGKAVWDAAPGLMFGLLTSGAERRRVLGLMNPTDEELAGGPPRVVPDGLIKAPAWLPCFNWARPYTKAIEHFEGRFEKVDAFAYDWRLDVHAAARLLGQRVSKVVAEWRGSDQETRAREWMPDRRPGGVILVAHSMGGLVVRALLRLIAGQELEGGTRAAEELASSIHGVVEVGVPRRGAPGAFWAATGRLSDDLAASGLLGRLIAPRADDLDKATARMPGVYDLLPTYPAVWEGDAVSRLDRGRLTSWGADGRLVDAAFERRAADSTLTKEVLDARFGGLVRTRVAGRWQPTEAMVEAGPDGHPRHSRSQCLVDSAGEPIRDGAQGGVVREEALGDGTVPWLPGDLADGVPTTGVQQRHSSLLNHPPTLDQVELVADRQARESQPLGANKELGLDPPPLAVAGQEFRVEATGVENLRAGFRVCAYDTGEAAPTRGLEWVDRGARTAAATVVLPSPGLYEVRLGTTPQIRELIGVVAVDG